MGIEQEGRRTYLYGLDGVYHVIRYCYIPKEDLTVSELNITAHYMKSQFPSIETVFAADNSYRICKACQTVMKYDLLDDKVLFKDMLNSEGIRII